MASCPDHQHRIPTISTTIPVKPITSLKEFQELINSGKVIFIDFWADWCGPCKMISPTFEKLAAENENTAVEFYKVNVDDQPGISQEAGIRAMPTFQIFKGGAKVDELVGAHPAALTNFVRRGNTLV